MSFLLRHMSCESKSHAKVSWLESFSFCAKPQTCLLFLFTPESISKHKNTHESAHKCKNTEMPDDAKYHPFKNQSTTRFLDSGFRLHFTFFFFNGQLRVRVIWNT